jgi:hypothetical protein
MFFATEEGLLIQTQLNGIYRLTGTSLSKFSTEVDSEMINSVYSCDQLSDGSYVIGTVSNGVFILTSKERLNIIFLKTKVE